MADSQRPKVGVGVIIHDAAGNIVMGERAGSAHGRGTFQCPGGHLEHGETFAETAVREVREETGLEVGHVRFLTATNDVFEEEEGLRKHYVTVFVTCSIVGEDKVSKSMEPHKCAAWEWVPWSQMWAWAKAQAEAEAPPPPPKDKLEDDKAQPEAQPKIEPKPLEKKMFLPLVNLYREYPELEHCLLWRASAHDERKGSEAISGWSSRHW
ncbi:uncharacterized protein K460DRAFT_315685 [Cucurbitaria berberidis CBS 394.84]|uniref:Nudix hydrolase domain-containing protein n=1 Tax=Cucurbitaria berberidis CBS 394.84 TaxID=1168544 RepID=A0A9P4L6T1_9PLEO|nr:uncharacterized protein K460DRAFT_315685 [Cucurbitaria berberidis CBS 394.84]KAF1843398.1 hypothetical protein K460DRAFT_315685 [Cucurbitaria berberidis CBS 394.84]